MCCSVLYNIQKAHASGLIFARTAGKYCCLKKDGNMSIIGGFGLLGLLACAVLLYIILRNRMAQD